MTQINMEYVGESFDDFLKDEGMYEEVNAGAVKKVIAWQIEQEMKRQKLNKAQMANRMGTSRSSLDRLLDPTNDSVALLTLVKAASALGKQLQFTLA